MAGGPALTYRDLHPLFEDMEDWTLPHVLATRARTHGDKVYLDVPFEDARYTYAEVDEMARGMASALLDDGFAPGDRFMIMAPNSSAVLQAWFASSYAGMAEVPINTAYRGTFLEHQVRTTAPRLAMIDASFAERFVESRDACASIERFFLVGDPSGRPAARAALGGAGWEVEDFEAWRDRQGTAELPEVGYRDLASIFFTSGTTGLSKGVQMSHAHMYFFAQECVSLTRCTSDDVYMSVGPLFHGNAQFLAAQPALIAGARFVLHEKFSASNWLTWIRQSKATITNFVGVMMDFVFKQPPTAADADNELRCIFAAPTASSILDDFKSRFGVEAFVEVFGLTETSTPIMSPYAVDRPPGAAGLLVSDYFEVRLADPETDEAVAVGQVGELLIRSKIPWITTLGYYGMPEKTLEATRNLWFHTGDALRQDEDGWFYFVDRYKDAIRRRGENISSYEVEQAFLEHPAVSECAAIGVPADTEAGEDEVMVFVVLRAGADRPSFESLWEWAEARLPYFTVPRYLRWIDEVPKTPSEKVLKRELREIGPDARAADRGPSAANRGPTTARRR